MEQIILILMLFIAINCAFKLSLWKWWQTGIYGLITAVFTILAYPYAILQSKTQIADYLQNTEALQNMAVIITLESAVCFGFCVTYLRGLYGRKNPWWAVLLWWYPSMLFFPVVFYCLTESIFTFVGIPFTTTAYIVAAATLVAVPGMAQLVKYLVPEKDLRLEILRDGRFFGNHDEYSDSIARRLNESLYRFAKDRTDLFGTPLTYGNLTGYNPHFAFFGSLTGATPDGRVAGSALTFGSGQVYGKELNGITSHLLSVAQMDPTGVLCGNTIMNLTVDNSTVRNEEGFEKLVLLIETYFKAGGLHIQLNYLSREELIAAKADQEKYKNLRVRVSGFSATFVKLNESLQENIIARTSEEVE